MSNDTTLTDCELPHDLEKLKTKIDDKLAEISRSQNKLSITMAVISNSQATMLKSLEALMTLTTKQATHDTRLLNLEADIRDLWVMIDSVRSEITALKVAAGINTVKTDSLWTKYMGMPAMIISIIGVGTAIAATIYTRQ